MPACLSYFLFCCCNKMPWQKQVKEKGIYLVHEGTGHPTREIKGTGAWGRGITALLPFPAQLRVRWLGKAVHRYNDFTHYHGKIPDRNTWKARGLFWVIAWLSWWARHGCWSIRHLVTYICIQGMEINGCWDSSHFILLIQSQRLWDCKTMWVFPLEWNLWKHLTDTPRDMLPWWFSIQSCWQWRLTSQHIIPKYCLILRNWTWLLVWNYAGTGDNLDLHLLSKGL